MNNPTPTAKDRKPTAFGDLRGWIGTLRDAGELAEIDQEVNWDVELGTIVRMAQGTGYGPPVLDPNVGNADQRPVVRLRIVETRLRSGWQLTLAGIQQMKDEHLVAVMPQELERGKGFVRTDE